MKQCIFCDIIQGKIPSYKIYEDEYTYAFLDIANDANGHILVIPKIHCENVFDCPNEVLENTIKTVKKIGLHLVQKCGFSGINILNASGKDAEQSVSHLHFHILPRKEGDGINAFPNLAKNPKSLEELQQELEIKQELR